MSESSFTRVAVLLTAFKRTPSGRVRPVRGLFRSVRASGLAFRPDDLARPVTGSVEIDLASLTTDAQERDANVVNHLFGTMRAVSATIEPAGQILTLEGDDAWRWRGLVALSFGARIPINLQLRRRRIDDRVEVSARLFRPLDTSITDLGLPFAAFLNAVGVPSVIDRVELEVGIVFDEQAEQPRVRVVIAGAGIAGLAAAQTLASAGCDVTILEKERFCGGKLTSHIDETSGHTVEHGIHGVFPPYRNLVDLWREAGIDDSIFADTDTVGIATPTGMTAENFHEVSGQAPMFLREMLPEGLLRARDFAAGAAFLSRVYATMADRDLLDRDTFQALLERYGVSARVQRFVMHPYVKNLSYARPDQVSAAAACDALGYYMFENADNFKARWFNGGPQELVIDPWVFELAKRGVRFLTNTPVKFVVFENGLFGGFATRAVIPSRSLGSRERAWTQRFGSRVLALRWLPEREQLCAWDGLCTHAGCPLQPAGEHGLDGFRCDCHGGAFDVEGRVLRAPPTRNLDPLSVIREEVAGETFWKIALDESGEGDGVLAADYGIIALDIEGARSVLSSNLLDLPSTRGISSLRTTPLMVLRIWFRGADYSGPDSGFFQADDLLDNF
ncbi:MAG TPA: FAD-dependent oxidoreductase, partial [Labilithrix sp.]|nr:FAD-dependent oxidoreductase [Labilithrix sp.]